MPVSKHIDGIPETVRVKEAAALLHCTYRYIQDLMYTGKLKYYKPTSRVCLIDVDSLRSLFSKPENSAVLQGGE